MLDKLNVAEGPKNPIASSHFLRDSRGMTRKRMDDESVPAISHRLRLLRHARVGDHFGSKAEFARLMDINPATWSGYETEVGRINVDTAMELYKRLGVTMEWVYLGIEAMMPADLMREIRRLDQPSKRRDGTARRG